MNKVLVMILAFLLINTALMAEDVILVAAKVKIDAYSPKDMKYLGKFADLKELLKPTCMAISSDDKLIVAGSALSYTARESIIKLNSDGTLDKVLFENTGYNTPIDTPKAIVELDDGSLVVFDTGNKKVFKISKTGEFLGDFFQVGSDKAELSRISTIFKYGSDIVVAASDPDYKLVEYDANGVFVTNLTDGNEYILNPFHISKTDNGYIMVALALIDINGTKEQISTLIQLDNDLILVKKLISDNDIKKKSLIRPRFALKNESTGKYLIIDEGRNRGTTKSYDDNLELFSPDGRYEKSLGTYEDTLLRHIILFKGSTKKWK